MKRLMLLLPLLNLACAGSKVSISTTVPFGDSTNIPVSVTVDRTNKPIVDRDVATMSRTFTVGFDFDRYNIKNDQFPIISTAAGIIFENPQIVTIEGHCDERGTTEYNMALGMRRALAVKRVMRDLGIDKDLLQPISYGKEKPIMNGHDESSWVFNRRCEFTVK